MNSNIRDRLNRAFVLQAEDYLKIYDLLVKYDQALRVTIECKDKMTKRFNVRDELLAFENPDSKRITEMRFYCGGQWGTKNAQVFLRTGSPCIEYNFEGDDEEISKARNAFTDIVEGMTPWYAKIARTDFYTLFFRLLMGFGSVAFLLSSSLLFWSRDRLLPLQSPQLINGVYIGMILGLLPLLGAFFNAGTRRLFPMTAFAIGQGKMRHENLEKWRWTAVVGFAVNIGAAFVMWLVLR